jgi:hypothetical protein
MNNTITLYRDGIRENFVFPIDKIAYVKFNDYARQITVAPIGAEAIFFNIPKSYGKRDEYDETKSNILKALNREE